MDKREKIPAVVLSSHVVGLGVIRALGSMGVPVIAASYQRHDMGRSSKYVTSTLQLPDPDAESRKFVDELLKSGRECKGRVLIPADDNTLMAVSRHKEELSSCYRVACPDWGVTQRVADKSYTYLLAESVGIKIPRTVTPSSREHLKSVSADFEYPCILKPCLSQKYAEVFHRKYARASDEKELLSAYDEAAQAGFEVMVQEYIPGPDSCGVHFNSYFCEGKVAAHITAAKVRMSPPGAGVPRVVVSRDVPEIQGPATELLRAAGFNGFSCTEFKKDPRDGEYKLLEINGRHNRSGLLSLRCGINFPWLEYCHLVWGELVEFPAARNGVYWIDEFHDVLQSVRHLFKERYTPTFYLKPYICPHTFAIFDWSDCMPFMKRCGAMPAMLLERICGIGREVK